jgi:acetoacetyl-CoA synthetase
MSLLWQPSADFIAQSNLKKFQTYAEATYARSFFDYDALWQWSVEQPAQFWQSVADFFQLQFHSPASQVLRPNPDGMIGTQWFPGATLNYAQHVFRHKNNMHPAIIFQSEVQPIQEISWNELEEKVKSVQQYLKKLGVEKGDRVVGYLPNNTEAVIIFLAVNSLGAIWSCCSPDFGTESVVDRFQQIAPKVLFATEKYYYNGKPIDKSAVVQQLSEQLSTLQRIVVLESGTVSAFDQWNDIISQQVTGDLSFTPVDFQHPIWILYSSGTTGKPKAITHATGGNLIEHYKALALHQDVKPGERYLWYSTTGWMMWNYALSSLLVGTTLVIYDGSPGYPDLTALWKLVQDAKVNHFGVGAAFYLSCMKEQLQIAKQFDLSALRTLGSTGSPLPAEGFRYIYEAIKKEVWLISLSGGTDVCSAFVGGCPYLPVYEGEIQCKMLGCKLEAWNDEGQSVENELGELMLTAPMPSMPVFFWNDDNNERYRQAYFEQDAKVWRHGDWIKITEHKGIIIYGRSDATLNRDGVRIGTAEIYSAVESLPEIKDSLVVCVERQDGTYFMPLFVVLKEQAVWSTAIQQSIKNQLRQQYSPRHVPDVIFPVQQIPYTISGKKMEMPVKKLFMGMPLEKCVSLDTMKNPESMQEYVALSKS